MGEVYRARDTRLDRDVAIKVLAQLVSSDPERMRRFEVEAKAAAALNHPNILAVYQMGTYAGVPYLVSELLEGKTLTETMRRGPLPLRKVIDYGVQIAHGLAAAHDKGIIHRDLKPDNLFVCKDGRIKILDFGLAKVLHPEESVANLSPTLTLPGMAMGTVGYMSPEQVRGLGIDPRSDIFALGAILCEMMVGEANVSEAHIGRHDERDPERGTSTYCPTSPRHASGIGTAYPALSGEECRATLSVCLRSGLRARTFIRSGLIVIDCGASDSGSRIPSFAVSLARRGAAFYDRRRSAHLLSCPTVGRPQGRKLRSAHA